MKKSLGRKIGIVGARDFPVLDVVRWYVESLSQYDTVITGGARGVDKEAEFTAQFNFVKCIVHLPVLDGCDTYEKKCQAYYARNQKIVDDANELFAFTHKTTGGTWDTIRRAVKKGIPVTIISK